MQSSHRVKYPIAYETGDTKQQIENMMPTLVSLSCRSFVPIYIRHRRFVCTLSAVPVPIDDEIGKSNTRLTFIR